MEKLIYYEPDIELDELLEVINRLFTVGKLSKEQHHILIATITDDDQAYICSGGCIKNYANPNCDHCIFRKS